MEQALTPVFRVSELNEYVALLLGADRGHGCSRRPHQPNGALGVNTTGMDSRPLTKFAGRNGSDGSAAASRRSGSRRNTRPVINDSSRRAN